MFCKSCGNPLNGMEKFCANCGSEVVNETITYQTNSYYQEQDPNKKPIKKTGLLVWSILEILSCISFLPGVIALVIWLVGLNPAISSGDEVKAKNAKLGIKCVLWIGVLIWLGIIGIFGAIMVNGLVQSNKSPITVDEFYSQIQETDYNIYKGNEILCDLYIVCDDSGTRMVEFYKFEDDGAASRVFAATKERFEQEKGNSSIHSSVEFGKYAKYTLETNGQYKAITKRHDTLLYADVNSRYKNDVEDIFKKLDY